MAKNIESKSSGESVMQPTITGSRNHLTPNRPYAVVDVGSTKIAIAVLNMDENPQLIYGCASTKTTAVTKGKVTDIDVLSNNISETLKKALNSNEIPNEIPGIVSISGTHVKGVNEIESLTLNNSHGVITFEDIKRETGKSEGEVIKIMRSSLKSSSFKLWRRRVHTKSIKITYHPSLHST